MESSESIRTEADKGAMIRPKTKNIKERRRVGSDKRGSQK
jgi:hypothetical protein